MAAIKGRDLLIKYDSGAGAVAIAGAQSGGLTTNKEPIDITDKSDAGVRTYLEGVGTWSMEGTVAGVLKGTTLIDLVEDPTGTQLLDFEIELVSIGTWAGKFFISSFEVSGEEGSNATTFTANLMSSGTITWTAAA